MKRHFQIVMTLSLFVLIMAGFGLFVWLSYQTVRSELRQQVMADNQVIGEQIIGIIDRSVLQIERDTLETLLQHLCEKIRLPNGGFICATNPDGQLIAAPREMLADREAMKRMDLTDREGHHLSIADLDSLEEFSGTGTMGERTDIIVSRPVGNGRARLMVHQNLNAIESRARRHLHTRLIIGFTTALVISLVAFIVVNRLVNRYEHKLEQANQRLTESNRNLGQVSSQRRQLIHVLSHDLVNPIGAVHTTSELLAAEEGPCAEWGGLIQESAKQALGMIDLVRKLQALETGKLKIEPGPVHLAEAFADSLSMLRELLRAKSIEPRVNIPDHIVVQAEKVSLTNTVFNNLLTNAVKFSFHGGFIEIDAYSEKGEVVLTVRDHGIGIPENIRQHLFDITYSTSRAGTDGEQGTGFGMPLIKRFMEAFGGRIEVISSEEGTDKGTIVRLHFQPFQQDDAL